MPKLANEQVMVMVLAHHAALTALFATHPDPALLLAAFRGVADELQNQIDDVPVLTGMYQATVEQLERIAGSKR